jgi:hypothetical protein
MRLFLLWLLLLERVNGSENIWFYYSDSKKTSKEKLNVMHVGILRGGVNQYYLFQQLAVIFIFC